MRYINYKHQTLFKESGKMMLYNAFHENDTPAFIHQYFTIISQQIYHERNASKECNFKSWCTRKKLSVAHLKCE